MPVEEDHVEIPLTQGLITWISLEDVDVAGWGWTAKNAGHKGFPTYYAFYTYTSGGVRTECYLHDLIWERMMGQDVPRGFLIDHINGDKLDNRRENLRLATKSQNEQNKKKRRSNTSSRYKGVAKVTDGRKKCWRATITVEGRNRHIGTFYSEKEAAVAYNKEAYRLFQEFAVLNEFDDPVPAKEIEPEEELRKYKARYNKQKKGRPRKDPRGVQQELRRTGRPVGRPRKHPKYTQHQLRRKAVRLQMLREEADARITADDTDSN